MEKDDGVHEDGLMAANEAKRVSWSNEFAMCAYIHLSHDRKNKEHDATYVILEAANGRVEEHEIVNEIGSGSADVDVDACIQTILHHLLNSCSRHGPHGRVNGFDLARVHVEHID